MVLFQSAITDTNYVHNSSINFNFNTHFWESLRYWDGSRGEGEALAATYQSKIKSSGNIKFYRHGVSILTVVL